MFTEKERKLLRLALGQGAFDGEIDNSAVMFLRSLRARGVRPEEIENGAGQSTPAPSIYCRPDFGLCRMRWGKHKGSLLKDIRPSYLIWAVRWIEEDEDRARHLASSAEEIHNFLDQ
jgi:hypothetical protein